MSKRPFQPFMLHLKGSDWPVICRDALALVHLSKREDISPTMTGLARGRLREPDHTKVIASAGGNARSQRRGDVRDSPSSRVSAFSAEYCMASRERLPFVRSMEESDGRTIPAAASRLPCQPDLDSCTFPGLPSDAPRPFFRERDRRTISGNDSELCRRPRIKAIERFHIRIFS